MNRKTLILLVVFTVGLLILILPDDGTSVVRLNEKHGPSWMDLMGLLLMVIGWAGLSYSVVTNWKMIAETFGQTNARLLLALYIVSILEIVMALEVRIEWMLWIAIAAASIINASFIVVASLHRRVSTH